MEQISQNKLQELLLLALTAEGAEMGLIRSFNLDDDELVIVSHHGLEEEFVSLFHAVKPFDHSSCGRAFGIGSTIIISDIEQDLSFKKQIAALKSLNVQLRAVKSVPVFTQRGRKVGVLTLLFREPKWDWHFRPTDKTLSDIADILYKATKETMNNEPS